MASCAATRCCRWRAWVEQGSGSFWTFCVDYLEPSAGAPADSRPAGQRGKVDYKEVLKPEEFAVFARLRGAQGDDAGGGSAGLHDL